MKCDRLWTNARLATMAGPALGVVENALLATSGGSILYAGPAAEAPRFEAAEIAVDELRLDIGLHGRRPVDVRDAQQLNERAE